MVNKIKNKEYSIFLSTVLLTLFLVIIDVNIRGFLLSVHSVINVIYLFSSLYILQCLLSFFRKSRFILPVSLLFSLLYAGVLLFQYSIYNLYQSFATDEIFKTVILDYQYWLNNFIELLDAKLLVYYSLLCFILFVSFSNIWNKFFHLKIQQLDKFKCFVFYVSIFFVSFTNPQTKSQTAEVSFFKNITTFLLNNDNYMVSKVNIRRFHKIEPKSINFNVLLLVNESLRSDHLNIYGYERNTSPALSQSFKDALIFKNCFSSTAITHAGLLGVFTGLYPSKYAFSSPTIWQYASQLNLHTFYFGSQLLSWSGGLDKFFLEYDFIDKVFSPITADRAVGHDDSITVDAFKEYIVQQEGDKHFFGVIHFNSTHFPYLDHKQSDQYFPVSYTSDISKIKGLINAYDNSIINLDNSIDEVMEILESNHLLDNTIVVLLSDHAEAFGEHGEFFHTVIMHNEAIKVPLLILLPDKIRKNIEQSKLDTIESNENKFISNMDVIPTLLDLYDIPVHHDLDGISLFNKTNKSYVFSTNGYDDTIFTYINRITGKKFLFDNRKSELYITNLESDPHEKKSETIQLNKEYNRQSAMKYIQKIESIK